MSLIIRKRVATKLMWILQEEEGNFLSKNFLSKILTLS